MAEVEIFGVTYKVGPWVSLKIWLAKHRLKVLKIMRCSGEMHNAPYDQTFRDRGSIYVGGSTCTYCGNGGRFVVAKVFGPRGPFPSQRVQKKAS